MPIPINKNQENQNLKDIDVKNITTSQDLFNMFPIFDSFKGVELCTPKDKKDLKEIWKKSKSVGENKLEIPEKMMLYASPLITKGLLKKDGENVQLTEKGAKILRDSILNNEESSLTKQASKKLIAKNSYDFGEEVLVRVANKKIESRYAIVPKKNYLKKNKCTPRSVNSINLKTRKSNGEYKNISDYSDEELIKVLHVAKKVVENSNKIAMSSDKIKHVPVHRIKEFSNNIFHELNRR